MIKTAGNGANLWGKKSPVCFDLRKKWVFASYQQARAGPLTIKSTSISRNIGWCEQLHNSGVFSTSFML